MTQHEQKRVATPEEILEDYASDLRTDESKLKPPRCPVGSRTENPCWREANTTSPRSGTLLCEEHARASGLAEEYDYWSLAEGVTSDWLRVAEYWEHDDLERLARIAHEEAKAATRRAQARAGLAYEIADAPPPGEGKPRLTLEQEERLAVLADRADSFNNAYTALEDAEGFADEDRRQRIMGVLSEASKAANEEHARYREELGLKD